MLDHAIAQALDLVKDSEKLSRMARIIAHGYIDSARLDAIDADTAELRRLLEAARDVNQKIADAIKGLVV